LSQAEARLLATSLKRWAERPIRRANLRVAGISVVTIAFTVVAANQAPDPASAARGMAILFAAIQSVVHVVTTGMLRALGSLGLAEAATALASYRDPRRLSAMDLMAMWLAVAIAVPFFGE
jgi:mannose/fructose/N-acetylgalactosamine-specific phosphotransferase system component IIC